MAIILSDRGVAHLRKALGEDASQADRDAILDELEYVPEAPDEIDLFRTIRRSGERSHVGIAKAIAALWDEDANTCEPNRQGVAVRSSA